jgi:hypothetical protein
MKRQKWQGKGGPKTQGIYDGISFFTILFLFVTGLFDKASQNIEASGLPFF